MSWGAYLLLFLFGLMIGCANMKKKDSGDHRCELKCNNCEHVELKCNLDIDKSTDEATLTPP